MSLGLVVLEKKLFTRTRTPTPQSDDIMSADIKISLKQSTISCDMLGILWRGAYTECFNKFGNWSRRRSKGKNTQVNFKQQVGIIAGRGNELQ